jgi:4-amino-4-deoxy-L-arabinose transferase-like glycosyltransferase
MGSIIINKFRNNYAVILLLLCCIFFPFAIGSVHLFDWDEVNFAEIAREMIVNKNYLNVQINYLPFWEKPPLFFWLQALSMKIFGINEFASRLPNVMVGITSILSLFYIGKKFISDKFAFIWGLSYFGSLLPHFYFKTGIIDPLFNLFIFLSLYFIYLYQVDYQKKQLLIGSIFAGLAVLTKGPVAVLIILLVVFFFVIYKWKTIKIKIFDLLIAAVIIGIITSFWFISEIINGGGIELFKEFIAYQIRLFTTSEAGHGEPFYYHFIVLFFGCFPISLIVIPYLLKRNFSDSKSILVKDFYTLNFILFWVVLILFSITTTKIVHYSSLCYFPMSFMAAYIIYKYTNEKKKLHKISYVLLTIVGILIGFIFTAIPLIVKFKANIIPLIKDKFAVQNILLPVQWGGYEFLLGLLYIVFLVIILIKLKNNIRYIQHLFLLNALILNLLMIFIVPKIEQHTQGSMIAFFQKHNKPNEYVTTYGFRSYAKFFYTNKQKPQNLKSLNEEWLLKGTIDKPVYIVSKMYDKERVLQLNNIQFLYEKGGFAFYVRNKIN